MRRERVGAVENAQGPIVVALDAQIDSFAIQQQCLAALVVGRYASMSGDIAVGERELGEHGGYQRGAIFAGALCLGCSRSDQRAVEVAVGAPARRIASCDVGTGAPLAELRSARRPGVRATRAASTRDDCCRDERPHEHRPIVAQTRQDRRTAGASARYSITGAEVVTPAPHQLVGLVSTSVPAPVFTSINRNLLVSVKP